MGKIVRKVVRIGDKPTPEQVKEIEDASKIEPMCDEDCPFYSYEELRKMLKLTEEMKDKRRKKVVTLRISDDALNKAKAMGKGYTGFLSRLVENALDDKDLVMRSL